MTSTSPESKGSHCHHGSGATEEAPYGVEQKAARL
jgi:hypothetical protein